MSSKVLFMEWDFWKQLSGTGSAIVMTFGRKVKAEDPKPLKFLWNSQKVKGSRAGPCARVPSCCCCYNSIQVLLSAFSHLPANISLYICICIKHRAKKFTNEILIEGTIILMIVGLDGSCGRCYLAVATVVLCCWQYHLWSAWYYFSGFREQRGDPC